MVIGPALQKVLLISLGAVVGVNARYWIGDWAAQKWGTAFPFGTLLINITGSFVIGLFLTLTAERFVIDPRLRLLVVVGFIGTYTTFSTFSLETFNLLNRGQWLPALVNVLASTVAGIVAVGLGVWLGRGL